MDTEVPPATLTQKSSIEQILNAGWYLLELINEILDLAMLESGKAPLSEEPISLEEIMLECQAMVEPLAEKRGIMLSFPQVNRDFFVRADRTRLKQVVINLLTNAIKYNQSSGTVVVECGLRPHNRTRITISDTGAGLSPEKLAQLFQPFNRLGQEGSTEEGTGIGLVVSKRVVEMMGGVIGVASVVGVGSSFWFELHSASAPERLADGAGVMPVSAMQGSTDAQRTVLCVEDSPANMTNASSCSSSASSSPRSSGLRMQASPASSGGGSMPVMNTTGMTGMLRWAHSVRIRRASSNPFMAPSRRSVSSRSMLPAPA